MVQNTRISRRNFLKLNALLGSAAAVSVALPMVAVAKSIPVAVPTTHAEPPAELDLAYPNTIRFGTPTDVAATWHGVAWSVDAQGIIRKYDHQQRVWVHDADEADFPLNSELVLARWGRPAGPNQMLMVLAQHY